MNPMAEVKEEMKEKKDGRKQGQTLVETALVLPLILLFFFGIFEFGQILMTKQMITKDMIIAEVVERYPAAAGLMENFGLHCFGCHANPFETIESGVLSHGFSEQEMDTLLTDLNTSLLF